MKKLFVFPLALILLLPTVFGMAAAALPGKLVSHTFASHLAQILFCLKCLHLWNLFRKFAAYYCLK